MSNFLVGVKYKSRIPNLYIILYTTNGYDKNYPLVGEIISESKHNPSIPCKWSTNGDAFEYGVYTDGDSPKSFSLEYFEVA